MDMKATKLMAVAVAAFFCATAFGLVLSDDSYAADTVGHNVYIEIIGDDGIASDGYWMYFESDGTASGFATSGTEMCAKLLLPLTIATGDGYIALTYGVSGYNNATYAGNDGKWTAVEKTEEEYPAAEYLYFALSNGYISTAVYETLSDAEKAKWTYVNLGYGSDYMRNAQVDVDSTPDKKTYHQFIEVIDETGKVTSSKWYSYDGYETVQGLICFGDIKYANEEVPMVLSISKYGGVSVSYNGSGNNHMVCVEDGEWVHVTDTAKQYVESDAVAFSVVYGFIGTDVYNALSDEDKENWESSGMSYAGYEYQKVVSESTTGYEEDSNALRNGLIIGGVIVAILVVAGVVLFMRKK